MAQIQDLLIATRNRKMCRAMIANFLKEHVTSKKNTLSLIYEYESFLPGIFLDLHPKILPMNHAILSKHFLQFQG